MAEIYDYRISAKNVSVTVFVFIKPKSIFELVNRLCATLIFTKATRFFVSGSRDFSAATLYRVIFFSRTRRDTFPTDTFPINKEFMLFSVLFICCLDILKVFEQVLVPVQGIATFHASYKHQSTTV